MVPAVLKTILEVDTEPLIPENFKEFGAVNSSAHELVQGQGSSADQETATESKVNPVADNSDPASKQATADSKTLKCTPPTDLIGNHVYHAKVLERHRHSTQTFSPMGRSEQDTAYLVIVAPTASDDMPDLNKARAFTCKGDQAVTYKASVWHAPMIALGKGTDFAVLIHENDVSEDDFQEVHLDELRVRIKTASMNNVSAKAKKRKGQTEEAFQKELDQFHKDGPVWQTHDFFDEDFMRQGSAKMDGNRVKYAAERQYYLRNYSAAEKLITSANIQGRIGQELEVILRACRNKI